MFKNDSLINRLMNRFSVSVIVVMSRALCLNQKMKNIRHLKARA